MVTTTKLLNANKDMKLGNHRKETEGNITKYIYHWTAIVTVDEENKTYTTDNGGWNTQSTNRAINSYKYQLDMKGYKFVH